MASGKSLSKEENDKLRVVLGTLVEQHGSQKALHLAANVSQQMISHVIGGGAAGVHFANMIAKFMGYKSYTELIGSEGVPLYGDNPTWKENEAEAARMNPFPPDAYKLARETPAYIQRDEYTPSAIAATVVWRWAMASDEEKRRVGTTRNKDDMARDANRRRFVASREKPSEPKLPPAKRKT